MDVTVAGFWLDVTVAGFWLDVTVAGLWLALAGDSMISWLETR